MLLPSGRRDAVESTQSLRFCYQVMEYVAAFQGKTNPKRERTSLTTPQPRQLTALNNTRTEHRTRYY